MKSKSKGNVVLLKNSEPIEWHDTYQVCRLLQSRLITSLRSGTKCSEIASRCKLAPSTVTKIAYGDTKEPRTTTVLTLLYYFGYKVTIS